MQVRKIGKNGIKFLLAWYILYKCKQFTKPFSNDMKVMMMVPVTLYTIVKRRFKNGALYPEWTLGFEMLQGLLNMVAMRFGSRIAVPACNAIAFRENSDRLFKLFAYYTCYRFQLKRDVVFVDDVKCEWVVPKVQYVSSVKVDTPYVLFYLHGGGYTFFSPSSHLTMVARILRSIQFQLKMKQDLKDVKCFFVEYRKSPEHVFPAATEDVVKAYDYIHDTCKVPSSNIIVAGDSAGGGLVLSLLMKLREKNREMPNSCICLSPLVDLLANDPNVKHDIISKEQILGAAKAYLEDENDAKLASPLYNDLGNLPPLFIQCGDTEYLYPQVLRLATRARADGTSVVLDVHKNMPHVFTFFNEYLLPKSMEGIDIIGKFAAHQFHNGTNPLIKAESLEAKSMLRRNSSSCELDKDNFKTPEYLSKDMCNELKKVHSAVLLDSASVTA